MATAILNWRTQRTARGDVYLVRYVWDRNTASINRGQLERVIDNRAGLNAIALGQAPDNPNAIDIKIRVSTAAMLGDLLQVFVFADPDDEVPLQLEEPVILLDGIANTITTGWNLIEDTAREAGRAITDPIGDIQIPSAPQINFGLAALAVIVVGGFLLVRQLT